MAENNFSNDLNEIEDMDVDQQVSNDENLQQSKQQPTTKGGNNKEAEILDIDDIPEFEWENHSPFDYSWIDETFRLYTA